MGELSDVVDVYKANGNSCYQNGAYEEAVEWYTKAIGVDSENALLYNNRSAAYLMMNKYLEAFKDSSKSVQLNPSYCKALLRYVKCCISLGKIAEAKNVCFKIKEIEPNNTDLLAQMRLVDLVHQTYQLYENQLSLSDFPYALHLINQCIQLAPGSLDYNLKKIDLLIRLRRFAEAKKHVEVILKLHEPTIEVLYYRGLCLFYLDHLDKAVSHFQHVLRLHPDHVESQKTFKRAKTLLRLKEQGNRHIHERRFSEAYETYSDALAVDPLHDAINSKLLCNRACAGYNLERYEAALDDCNRAIDLDPSYTRAYIRRAKCYSILEMHDKALDDWSKIVSISPTNEHKQGLNAAKRALAKSKEIDYYKVLGIKKNSSFDEIKLAYKKLALQHHPDRHTQADNSTRQEQEQKFKEIGEAYSVLSDPAKRRQYDSGVYSSDNCSQSTVHAHNLFTQVFSGFGGNATTVHFCFT